MSSYLRVLRHPDFRYLFFGQSASAVGDQVVIVALALYITQHTGSITDLGLVLAAQTVPLVALILFGGVWADRLPRQRIMIVADLARAVLHGILALLILAGGASVGQMVVIEALFGAARAFFQPAYTGLLPQTISESLIQDARALTESTANVAILVGPALGTVLVLGPRCGRGVRARCRHVPAQRRAAGPRACSSPRRPSPRPGANRSCTSCAAAGGRCARAPGYGRRSPPSPAPCCAATRSGTPWRRRSPRTCTATSACSACSRAWPEAAP